MRDEYKFEKVVEAIEKKIKQLNTFITNLNLKKI